MPTIVAAACAGEDKVIRGNPGNWRLNIAVDQLTATR
jgi:hypothetical protein